MKLVDVVSMTDQGQRPLNEDAALHLDGVPLLAVADGMGGEGAGDVATRLAMDVLRVSAAQLGAQARQLGQDRSSQARLDLARVLETTFQWVDHEVEGAAVKARRPRMATTLVCAVVAGPYAFVAHVGNSRAYLFRSGRLQRLTEDHTVETLRRQSGRELGLEGNTEQLGRLTRVLGAGADPAVDIAEVPLAHGDLLLLCTDGITRSLDDAGIAGCLDPRDLRASARALLATARASACGDNMALVLASTAGDRDVATVEAVAERLRDVPLLRGLSDSERYLLVPYLEEHRIAPGADLVTEGQQGDSFFVLVEGSVRISRGRTHITTVGPGGHLGEVSLARPDLRSATATAVEPVFAYELTRCRFLELSNRKPSLGIKLALPLLDTVSERLRDLTDRVAAADLVLRGEVPVDEERRAPMALAALQGELTRRG